MREGQLHIEGHWLVNEAGKCWLRAETSQKKVGPLCVEWGGEWGGVGQAAYGWEGAPSFGCDGGVTQSAAGWSAEVEML